MQVFKLSTELNSFSDRTPYKALIEAFDQKYLVGLTKITSVETGFREQHQAGDELLVILSGKATFTCQHQGETKQVWVEAGDVLFIPQGAIHSANLVEELHILFLTPNTGNRGWVEATSLPD
jgi:mannose-6-phosphate isomerase-like protein (cupin superfamily)